MPVQLPGPDARWRCGVCGNLTRFDVTRVVRSRDYVHVDLAGSPRVEEHEVLAETVEQVRCRWCGVADKVVAEPRPGAQVDTRTGPSPSPGTRPDAG